MSIPVDVTESTTRRVKELRIHCKVVDQFGCALYDDNGCEIARQEEDYVPSFMPGKHYGDYIILNIDIETGRVLNWQQPSAKDLADWIEAHKS